MTWGRATPKVDADRQKDAQNQEFQQGETIGGMAGAMAEPASGAARGLVNGRWHDDPFARSAGGGIGAARA